MKHKFNDQKLGNYYEVKGEGEFVTKSRRLLGYGNDLNPCFGKRRTSMKFDKSY